MWSQLKDLPDEDYDFAKMMELMKGDRTSVLKIDEIVALNRTMAFYNTIKSLVDKGEVDLDMLKMFFGYNYNRFWNPEREKFQEHSIDSTDKKFFREILELKND